MIQCCYLLPDMAGLTKEDCSVSFSIYDINFNVNETLLVVNGNEDDKQSLIVNDIIVEAKKQYLHFVIYFRRVTFNRN